MFNRRFVLSGWRGYKIRDLIKMTGAIVLLVFMMVFVLILTLPTIIHDRKESRKQKDLFTKE